MEICFTNCTCVFLEQLQISFDYCFLKRIKRVCILLIHHTFFMVTLDFLSTSIRLLYEDEVLPRAMTCGNMLQLPSYSSKEPEFLGNIRQ